MYFFFMMKILLKEIQLFFRRHFSDFSKGFRKFPYKAAGSVIRKFPKTLTKIRKPTPKKKLAFLEQNFHHEEKTTFFSKNI